MKLVIFDVDGTLSDSQNHIVAAMTQGIEAAGLPLPSRSEMLSVVGLSLDEGMAQLLPDAPLSQRDMVVQGYRDAYRARRMLAVPPLYPGAAETLDRLAGREDMLLGIATGKSRRGLDALCEHHGIGGYFFTRQVADDHPSKPHPSMVLTALADAGADPAEAVMIGDTTYDIEMGRAAGVATIGVRWGYHPAADLVAAGADRLVGDFAALEAAVDELLGGCA